MENKLSYETMLPDGNNNFSVITLRFNDEEFLQELISRSNVRHNFFIFCLVLEGEGSVQINLKEFEVKPYHLLIIPPDANKDKIKISKEALIKVVSYTSDFIIQLPLPDNFWEMSDYFSAQNVPTWQLKQEEAEVMSGLIDQMTFYNERKNIHPYGVQILQHLFMIFIMELGALAPAYSQRENHRYSRKEALTIQFYGLAKKLFKEERSVQKYAQLLYVSPRYLTETVKEVSGRTAGEVIDTFTSQEAKILLTQTDKNISEIASDLNFSDQSAFGKFFKRQNGVSPMEFRKNLGIAKESSA